MSPDHARSRHAVATGEVESASRVNMAQAAPARRLRPVQAIPAGEPEEDVIEDAGMTEALVEGIGLYLPPLAPVSPPGSYRHGGSSVRRVRRLSTLNRPRRSQWISPTSV